jgi:hypothetical protein
MSLSDVLQIIAVLFEIIIACAGVAIATRRKKFYGWFIAVTFGLFVVFDIARIFAMTLMEDLHALIFLIACGSMMFAVWLMYNDG